MLERRFTLHWWVRLIAWVPAAALAVLVAGWWWLAAGPLVVEILLLALTLRVRRLRPAGGTWRGPDDPGGTGVREPRRPLPVAGAGAAVPPGVPG